MLCVDMDPQGNLTMSQGIDPDSLEQSMYDVLVHKISIREVIRKREIDVACASIDLAGAEIAMAPMIGRERALQRAFEPILEDYDFICIDTPPSLGLLTINALTAADKVIVPVQCEYLSMRGLIQLQNTLSMIRENLNPDVDIEGILPTLVDSRTIHAKEAIEILEENFGDRVFASRIRKTVRFAEAPVKGMSVLKYDPTASPRSPTATSRRRCSMARGKRASMREGPLAALFRKTEQDSRAAAPAQEPPRPTRRAARRSPTRRTRTSPARSAERAAPSAAARASTPATSRAGAGRRRRPEPPRRPQRKRRAAPGARRAARRPADHAFRRRRSACARRSAPSSPRTSSSARDPATARRSMSTPAPSTASRGPTSLGQPRLRVVGVGGGGVNAVNRMVEAGIAGVEFLAVNTDLQSLQQCTADVTVHIGAQVTRGLGSGANAELGRLAAMEEYDKVKSLLKGSDMIFITAGEGGGTGTGAAPVVARIAREVGALTVGIVTKPFGFEGTKRAHQAEAGIEALAAEVDTLIVVPNNRLLSVLDKQTSMVDAFRVADDVLRQGVQGVSDLVTLPGLINLDFADVRTVMSGAGTRAARHRHGPRRAPRDRCRDGRRLLAAAGDLDGRGALDPAVDHRRQRPLAVGGQRGREGRQRGRPSRREHHLRRDGRREPRRPGVGHGRRDRLRRPRVAPPAPPR